MDPITMSLLASAGSGLITKAMNPGQGYKKGQQQLDKYYNQGQGYMQPFMQQGQAAYGPLSGAMNDMLQPSSLLNDWMGDYKISPLAKMDQERARNASLRALSSMGMLGSTPGAQAVQAGERYIGAQDEQRYLDRLAPLYFQGVNTAQNLYGQGGQMASQMGQNAMNMGGESANMAYGQKSAPGNMFSNLMGTFGSLGGGYMGMQGSNNIADAIRAAGMGGAFGGASSMGGNMAGQAGGWNTRGY